MQSTREILAQLRRAHPETNVTEARLRHVLRRPSSPQSRLVAGRLIWTRRDVERLASALGLQSSSTGHCAGSGRSGR
jgi:hypothetical protein